MEHYWVVKLTLPTCFWIGRFLVITDAGTFGTMSQVLTCRKVLKT